jgi:sterol desaturase/sphingolipid hydroxylase (fatty acid hydroxylase superfamily)
MDFHKLLAPSLTGFDKWVVVVALETWVRYFLVAGLAWLLAYVVFKRRWFAHKIIPRFPESVEVRREIGYSLLTALVYGVVGASTFWMVDRGWTQIYHKINGRGQAWFWASVVVAIFIHDAYFYWTHRLMHHPKLFRRFHLVHHRSTNPSPWAAYSFAPLEAVVQAGIFPLLLVVMPMHILAFMTFMLWQITFNVLGHIGYEFFPRSWLAGWGGKFLNTPTHHVQHHERMRGNYGLYFNIWDRLMGTNHREYELRFAQATAGYRSAQSELLAARIDDDPSPAVDQIRRPLEKEQPASVDASAR